MSTMPVVNVEADLQLPLYGAAGAASRTYDRDPAARAVRHRHRTGCTEPRTRR